MIYQTIADIFETNDEVRSRLTARVENLDDAQAKMRAGTDSWSVAEIVEHLSITEVNMLQLTGNLLAHAESVANADANSQTQHAMAPFSLDELTERARTQKFVAPERVRPSGTQSITDSLARLKKSRASLHALRTRLEAADLSVAQYPHPIFGALNLYQWLAFIGLHETRHLNQIERVLEKNDEQ